MTRDPVCGKLMSRADARATVRYQNQTYFFCSRGCRHAFEREPEVCLVEVGVEKLSGSDGIERWVCRGGARHLAKVR